MGAITSHYNLAIIIQEQRRGSAVRDLKQDVTLLNQRLDKNGIAAGKAANKTEQFTTKAKRLGQAIRKVLVPALLLAATAAVKFGVDGVKAFAQFDKGMQEVFTLIPERSKEFEDELRKGIKGVGEEFGYLTEETIPALYQALSAGVPEENALSAVELAAKAAKAGASDLESTMRIGMAVVNAYGGEIYSLEEAYDLIFQLIDKGVPRMTDWANSLQDVISIASEARTPFEDIVAALAVMTRQGDSAAEAAELLGFILMQMQIEGTTAAKVFMEATGQSYREWISTGNGLVDGLIRLDEYAIQTGQHLDSMIGGSSNFYRDQQAARGTMELTGLHLQDLIDIFAEVKDSAEGSMGEAFITATDNAQQKIDEMSAKWQNLKLKIGEAIWTQQIFLGMTGEQLFDAAGNVLDYGTGAMGDEILDELDKTLEAAVKVDDIIAIAERWIDTDRSIEVPFLLNGIEIFVETAEEGNQILANELIKYIGNYEEWAKVTRQLGLIEDYQLPQVGYKYDEAGGGTNEEELYNIQMINKNNELDRQAETRFMQARRANLREVRTLRKDARAISMANVQTTRQQWVEEQRNLRIYDAQWDLQYALYQAGTDILDTEHKYSTALVGNVELMREMEEIKENSWLMVHWEVIETQKLNQEQLTFMDIVSKQGKALTTAFADLQAASGDWTTIMKDNSGEIALIMGDLAIDLTDEEKSIMQGILRDSEEGGADWLSSWRRLQTDLTETQRNELIARLVDLQASQGDYEGVWTGDREKAETAAKAIITALEAIDTAYYTMGENMVTNKILTDIRLTDTVAGQMAALEWQVALGNIDEEIAAPMRAQLDSALKLEPILDEMYTAYMGNGVLAREEAAGMALAIDVVKEHSDTLTEEGLKAYLDKALSETGGYPYVAGKIYELGLETDAQKKKQEELSKAKIVPKVELDKRTFDHVYEEMMEQIDEALGPHIVQFNARYNDEEADVGEASGTGGTYRTVPGGYPNDSYLVGLTTGEQYSVLTPSQQNTVRGGRQQYVDQSRHTTIINNHTAAAAAVSRAYLDTLYDKRLRRFAGE